MEHGGHKNLRGSGHRSVIPYIHRRMRVVSLCVSCVSFACRGFKNPSSIDVYPDLLYLKVGQLQ
jgi:hypothetical protein